MTKTTPVCVCSS